MQLPQSYDTLSSFTQFEIKSLQVEDAIWASEKIPAKVHSEWEETVSLMQEIGMKPRLRTFRSWLWASATISSRALHVPWDEAGCLCPVGDFFNYAAPGDESSSEDADEETSAEGAAWNSEASLRQRLADGGYEEDEAAYCFYARRRYNKGEQVLLCYGTYTNLELLEHYGFLLSLNPNDKAFIPLDPGMKTSSTWPRDAAYVQGDGRPSFALLSTLRLWATPHHLRRMVGRRAYSGLQLSVENEASVMKWLTNKCQAVLDELPTGPAEDSSTMGMVDRMQECSSWEDCVGLVQSSGGEIREFLLANGLEEDGVAGSPLPGKVKRSMRRFRLALQWRLCYKKALLQCISYCRDTIDTISSQRR
ncbi:unnamed protein product [Spirodela intermedia]|uniref:SET domain-containing protein n=1 Tax=Spirodela intermedia TaxID=51605 RepID=A0A7I8K3U6_SPIIN|nr:unnamed protein product [Spirodela intermedia]